MGWTRTPVGKIDHNHHSPSTLNPNSSRPSFSFSLFFFLLLVSLLHCMPSPSVSTSCPSCLSFFARRPSVRQASFSKISLGRQSRRSVSDHVRGISPTGNKIKYPLSKLVGTYQSRGTRSYQEDALLASALQINPEELKYSLRLDGGTGKSRKQPGSSLGEGVEFWGEDTGEGARGWEPTSPTASELALVGIFDGHGGKDVSAWLSEHMADYVETSREEDVSEVVEYMQSLGGYFRRFNGGLLSKRYSVAGKASQLLPSMTLAERLTLAYLRADRRILTTLPSANQGSTGSCALLHSLDNPSSPFFQAKKVNITIAHVGDTKILLTRKSDGLCRALTEKHHADARVEDGRLRKMGKNVGSVADAFGESRFMGVLENTRAFGDGRWKSTGVTSEPQITSRTINGQDYSYLILISDGISSQATDQEISDVARTAPTPVAAARSIVSFAEDCGSRDNCSAMVVPLGGWGQVKGEDKTKERREWRRREAEGKAGRMDRG